MALPSRLAVALLVLLAVAAPTAHAGTVPTQSPVAAGPLVSGSDAVWVEKTIADESLHVRRAPPDGPATTIQSFPGSGSDGCHFVEGFAGSATTVALLRRVARYDAEQRGCVRRRGWLLAFAKRTKLDVEIYARTLTARGAVAGDEVRLSQMGEDPQTVEFGSEPQEGHEPALTALARGRLLSAWVGRGKDDGKPETYARPVRAG
jgi:hypothetical protein